MKKVLFCLPILVLALSACKKDDAVQASSCRVLQSQYSLNGVSYAASQYEFDGSGRLSTMVFSNQASTYNYQYTYYPDSVVLAQVNQRTVYYLNAQGLAASATMVTSGFPASGMRTDYTYTYNFQGYLVADRAILTQYVGGVPRYDTSSTSYTIENGNITRMQSSDGNDYRYSYTGLPLTYNIPEFNPFLSNRGEFLGRKPANIVSEMNINSGLYMESYSYTSGADNRVTEKTVTRSNAPTSPPIKIAIAYQCN